MTAFLFGTWREKVPTVDSLLRAARERTASVVARSEILTVIGGLRRSWQRGGWARSEWLATGPEGSLGWSRPMIELALDHFTDRLDGVALARRLRTQLGDHEAQGSRAEPLGVVLHVVAANVFFGPAESVVAALVTRNVSVVKSPTGDGGFFLQFLRSLQQVCPEAAATIALVGWPGGNVELEADLAARVDGVVVAGGDAVIRAYRRLAPPTTELIEFGPRFSVAVVSSERTDRVSVAGLARDVALWEQSACTSAQSVYVQGEAGAQAVAERLAGALAVLAETLPEGHADLDARTAVAHFRERFTYARGSRSRVLSAPNAQLATVVFDPSIAFEPSVLHRNVVVRPYADLEALALALAPLRGQLQSVGLAVGDWEQATYVERLARCGARRFTSVGSMNDPATDVAHDGTFELARLVRHVASEGPRS